MRVPLHRSSINDNVVGVGEYTEGAHANLGRKNIAESAVGGIRETVTGTGWRYNPSELHLNFSPSPTSMYPRGRFAARPTPPHISLPLQ